MCAERGYRVRACLPTWAIELPCLAHHGFRVASCRRSVVNADKASFPIRLALEGRSQTQADAGRLHGRHAVGHTSVNVDSSPSTPSLVVSPYAVDERAVEAVDSASLG
jgi:hypothetical protein